ncbi:hypothetical protein HELA111659_01250 [Helicobacter labetoulli]
MESFGISEADRGVTIKPFSTHARKKAKVFKS